MQIGLDIGSTTIKIAVLDDAGKLLFAKYQRHYSQIAEKIQELLQELFVQFPLLKSARLAVSGSAGLGIAESCGLQFVQEVFAEKVCTERINPGTDVVIELGGEDAKEVLDKMRYTCKGRKEPIPAVYKIFNDETDDGLNMTKYNKLLGDSINSIIEVKEVSDLMYLFKKGSDILKQQKIKGLDDFELLAFVVIK